MCHFNADQVGIKTKLYSGYQQIKLRAVFLWIRKSRFHIGYFSSMKNKTNIIINYKKKASRLH